MIHALAPYPGTKYVLNKFAYYGSYIMKKLLRMWNQILAPFLYGLKKVTQLTQDWILSSVK